MGGIRLSIRRALAAGALLAVAATAQQAAAEDIESLRAEAAAVGSEITAMGERLNELEQRQADIAEELAATDAEVAEMELEIAASDEANDRALARFEERAVETYKNGTGTEVAMLLSAETLSQMETVAHAIRQSAALDEAALNDLLAAKTEAESAQARLDERKQALMDAQARQDALVADIKETVAERDRMLADLNDEIEELEREARIAAREEVEHDALEEAPELGESPDTPQDTTWGVHDPDRLEGTGPSNGIPSLFTTTGVAFEGEASWYGPGFEGNTTANGDIFDSRLYTVASKTLPFGTYLYVTHMGRGVVVYVNDRGPYVGDRILDLSHAAAQAIGISGVGWVRAEVIVKT
ncbi:MAG: septal ring lytic transglycosylase RlpA family protein [Actinomycetota bacterium]|nr:septal ring lytic transglycosylase RlpA family protein [Actinomycetota bacterium]